MRFDVIAVDARQQIVALELEAANAARAAEEVRSQGLSLISLESRSRGVRLALARRKRFPATLFSMELVSLLDAGLNLVEALQTLTVKENYGERQEVLSGLLAAISRGEPFSQAVAGFPQHFSPLYVATVKASERTGSMREALGRYIAYQEELERVRKKIVSASIYPVILSVVGTLVIGFLMFYVVPRFARVYEDMASTLPFFSRLLLGFGNFVGNHALALGFTGMLLLASAVWAFSRTEFRGWLNTRLWRIPALGERLKVYQLARFYRTTGMLLKGGTPLVGALGMAAELLHPVLRARLNAASRAISEGHPVSESLDANGLATPVALRMLTVGDRSGTMGDMMERIAGFHDEELSRWVDWFTRLFEPILMALIGLVIGAIVILMYMPIFELAGNLQ